LPTSTIYRVLVRHDLNRLSHLDRQRARPIRRYERCRPGELADVDVKKTGPYPIGAAHRLPGRAATAGGGRRRRRIGCAFLHAAIDDYSQLAHTEVLADEQG
jgi:hypothetical protein